MTNLDSIFKSRDITLPTKVLLVKAMVFPVVMYGCESWTVKKVERRRILAFELWCWRRLLRVPWTARRSNQSILKENSPRCSLEGLILNLNLQYFGPSCKEFTHWKRPWCWEGLGAGWEGDNRGWDGWMASLTRWMWVWENSGSWWWTGIACCDSWSRKESDTTERLNWTEHLFDVYLIVLAYPGGSVVKNRLQCRRHGFNPWVGKIPWRTKWQPTPILLPGKSHGQRRFKWTVLNL